MAKSPASLADLQWLADHLAALAVFRARTAPEDHGLVDNKDRVSRLQDWMAVMIEARVARLTQPEPPHHKAMMEAYEAAVTTWKAERERVASDYKGDLEIFDQMHPRPRLARFMIDQTQRRIDLATACDCPITVEHRPDCPFSPDHVSDASPTEVVEF